MSSFFTKRNIIIGLVVLILALSIPLGVRLVQQQTQLKSKATGTGQIGIKFTSSNITPPNCIPSATQTCTATGTNIDIEFTSPFGAP